MTDIVFPEFRDEWESLNYPFSDNSTLTTTDGLVIDPSLFLDASVYPAGLSAGGRLVSITGTDTSIIFTVGDALSVNLATATLDKTSLPTVLPLQDSYNRSAGMFLIDPTLLAVIRTWSNGVHRFAVGTADFVASACIPSPAVAVEGVTTNGTELLTGEVWMVGDRGVVLTKTPNQPEIRVDVVGDPLFVRRLCAPVQQFTTPRFIQTINGQKPDKNGNYNITVSNALTPDTILRIYAKDGALQIESAGPLIQG